MHDDDNQHRAASFEVVELRADHTGRLIAAGQGESVLTALDIARSLHHARHAVSQAAEVSLIAMELRHRSAELRQRSADTRQQSQSMRRLPKSSPRGSRKASPSR